MGEGVVKRWAKCSLVSRASALGAGGVSASLAALSGGAV